MRKLTFLFSFTIVLLIICQCAVAKKTNTLSVVFHIEPPYSYLENGKAVGENVSIARALAAEYGVNINFIDCPVARCMSMLHHGDTDMIVGIRKTKERLNHLNYFSSPIKVQHSPLLFYTLNDSTINIDRYEDLYQLKVGVLRGATYFDQFDYDRRVVKIPLTNYLQLLDMLQKGRIDTFIEREESIIPLVKQFKNLTLKKAKYRYDLGVESYIAISKKSPFSEQAPELSKVFDKLLKQGVINDILNTKKINL